MVQASNRNIRLAGALSACVLLVNGATAQPATVQAPPAAPATLPNPPTVDPRPADAPPLVPIDANRDGNFRIAPHYIDDPAIIEKANVPKGRVIRFVMHSADSKFYPTGLDNDGSKKPFDRIVAVYLPPRYVKGRALPFTVIQDERWYVPEDAPLQADNVNQRTDLAFIAPMLDNLIYQKRVPAMAAVMLSPGAPNRQRSEEYDTVSERYTQFVETEILPKIAKDYGIKFTKDPEGRATMGESSGAAAAMAMAWFHPELYHRVISYSGTFVALRRDAQAPNGAWGYHETLIPNAERKPLRLWLHVSEKDNGYNTPAEGMRNWVIANQRMADVLKAKGYPYQFVFAEGVGHVNRAVMRQTLPEAFEWAWKGYKAK